MAAPAPVEATPAPRAAPPPPRWPFWLGLVVLALAWTGPLPQLTQRSFAGHMTLHVAVVAVAAPLLAIGLVGSRYDPAPRAPWLFAAIPASFVELIVIWGWHAPAAHDAAAASSLLFAAEQASFLITGLLVWLAAFASDRPGIRIGPLAGVVALLFTSMHMTLLGALIGLSPRLLFHRLETCVPPLGLTPLEDQQVGGVIMLAVGGAAYLIGGLMLMARLLNGEHPPSAVSSPLHAGRP